MTANDTSKALSGERADLLINLTKSRHWLRHTARDLTDEQARQRTTASELTVGGLIKHQTAVEKNWASFIVNGPEAGPDFNNLPEGFYEEWKAGFQLQEGETLAGVLAEFERTAKITDDLLATLPDLDLSHERPETPWSPKERWTARRAFLHIASETFQHAGHADIIRESLDGAKSMG
jgi:hypothetical protein